MVVARAFEQRVGCAEVDGRVRDEQRHVEPARSAPRQDIVKDGEQRVEDEEDAYEDERRPQFSRR